MPAYDEVGFDPPAPLARVSLRNPHNAEAVPDVPMLVDSGADVTLIPTTFAVQIGLHADAEESYELMAFDGSISTAPVVQLGMSFLRKTFRGRFLLIDQEWGVLGRDILNLLTLLLDGPNLSWNEQRRGR